MPIRFACFRPATLGLVLFFCAGFADGLLVPFFPLRAADAGVPVYAIGLLFGCYASVAVDLKNSLGPAIGTFLYSIAPWLPWIAGIPLLAIASLGLGVAFGKVRPDVQADGDASHRVV